MTQAETVLVATVVHPERRFRISKAEFDKANAEAKEAGNKSPFIVQEEGCEGSKSYDQLNAAGKKAADKQQAANILAKAEAGEEEDE